MAFQLRPYQTESVQRIYEEWENGRRKTLLVLPTGCGKTVVMAEVIRKEIESGNRVMLLAHRGELLTQAADKIFSVTGVNAGFEKAEQTTIGMNCKVTVASVQSMQSEKRLEQFEPDYFQTILVDETHHVMSDSYQKVLEHFPNAKILGVTATADRSDKKCLGMFFDSLAYQYGLKQAVSDGYLVPIKARLIPLQIDLSNVKISSGDFAVGDLGEALEPYLEEIAKRMQFYCKGRKTVVFLPLIETSRKFCGILRGCGFKAAEVNGQSDDREEILHDFDTGKYDVLCNSMLLTEGWDCPSVDCVIVLRATKSRSLYAQMVGRGTRLSPETGKKDLLLLDFLWHSEKHNLCTPVNLVAQTSAVSAKMQAMIENAKDGVDIIDAEVVAESEIAAEREKSLVKNLKAGTFRKEKTVDPLVYFATLHDTTLVDYEPVFPWESLPPTDKQIETISSAGLDVAKVTDRGFATQIISRMVDRGQRNLSTPKQIRFLNERGFKNVENWTKTEASNMIGKIARNGYRVPRGINPALYRPH